MRTRSVFPALVVFTAASAGLLLQVVQTRIYAVVFWNHLVYFIVSIALLGFGISGTWLAFGPDTRLARILTLRRAAVGFVLTALVSSLLMPQFGVSFGEAFTNKYHLLRLLATYSIAVLPYFFVGWILGVVYRDRAEGIHFLYFADLVGAALGCLLVLALIQPLGAVSLILIACALVAVPILLATSRTPAAKAVTGAVLAGIGALFFVDDAINARILPERSKAFHREFQNLAPGDEKVVELSEWNLLARTDVVGTRKTDRKIIFIDGDAWTGMPSRITDPPPPFNAANEALVPHAAPYILDRTYNSVLVIGSGGGPDVWGALRAGAKRIDAVEINPTTARIVKKEYDTHLHGLFNRPGVRLWNEEGRGFLRSRPDTYDGIVINAIDTFAAMDSGAYVLAENYLYTVDAVKEYISRLNPKGVLSIMRWDYSGESPRLFAVMLEALYELGYDSPERCITAQMRNGWTSILVSPTPFSPAELAAARSHTERHGGYVLFPLPDEQQQIPLQATLNKYAQARREGAQEAFFDSYRFNIRPVYDDSPFFFHYRKPWDWLRNFAAAAPSDFVRGHWSEFTLTALLCLTGVALLLFVGVPLARRGPAVVPRFGLWLLFFCCLGVSFIFVEISLMQRFALLLGHPARSLALVLAALLFFAGVGSHAKQRLGVPLPAALGLLVPVVGAAAFLYPALVELLLGRPMWLRELATVALVAPLGFLMGMPFPTGLKAVSERSRDAVPWMWGVNGGATVLGSIAAIALAIRFGFTAVLVMAAAGYGVALLAYLPAVRHAAVRREVEEYVAAEEPASAAGYVQRQL